MRMRRLTSTPLFLPHTTGTTGRPKGVMLTHANVTWNVLNFLTSAEFLGDDVTIAFAPFFRVGGTGVNVLPVLFMGGTVVVPDDVEPDRMLTLIERHRVSVGFAGPALLEGLAATDRWTSADLSSLRFVLTGGAPVPDRLVRVYAQRGVPLVQGYGLSEAGPLALLLDAPSALRKSARQAVRRRSLTCGSSMTTGATCRPVRPGSCTFAVRT